MNYCENCGTKLSKNSKFCSNCGQKIKHNEVENIKNQNNVDEVSQIDKLCCPYCSSDNIQVQIVPQNKNRGFLTIIFYIILAFTIIGIPIMILIILLKGNKTINKKYFICQNCGKTFIEKKKANVFNVIINIIVFLFLFMILVLIFQRI